VCRDAQAAEDLLHRLLLCHQLQKPAGSRALTEGRDDVGWGGWESCVCAEPWHRAGWDALEGADEATEETPVSVRLDAGLHSVVARQLGRMPKQERWDGWGGGARARAHLQQCRVSRLRCRAQPD